MSSERAQALVNLAAAHSGAEAEKILEGGALGREQLREVLTLLQDALYELFNDKPNEKRMHKKLRDACLVFMNLDLASQVDDEFQAKAVKLLQENVIKTREKERLADELASMGVDRWKALDEDEVEALADEDDGLIAAALTSTQNRLDPEDTALADALTQICARLAAPFLAAFDAAALDALISGAAQVCRLAADGKSAADALQKTATPALEHAGVIKAMRKSFAGLLIGDIILRQVGKGLGVKEKLSVTDFIIFLACQVADKQMLPDADKEKLLKAAADLDSI